MNIRGNPTIRQLAEIIMDLKIEPYNSKHLEEIVRLSLRAWAPVFQSIEREMGPAKYRQYYPDWRATQKEAVESVCRNENMPVWTALDHGRPVGFVAVKRHDEDNLGEIYMVAVDPEDQGRGIASRLIDSATTWMTNAGFKMCIIDTGMDAGHAPARRAYEKLGFDMWPVARFYKEI